MPLECLPETEGFAQDAPAVAVTWEHEESYLGDEVRDSHEARYQMVAPFSCDVLKRFKK